jgi:hypothetical protein
MTRLGSEGDFDFHSGFQGDRGLQAGDVNTKSVRQKGGRGTHDLLDDFRGRVQVDQSLVDSHLVLVPGLGTFTTGAAREGISGVKGFERRGRKVLTTFGW